MGSISNISNRGLKALGTGPGPVDSPAAKLEKSVRHARNVLVIFELQHAVDVTLLPTTHHIGTRKGNLYFISSVPLSFHVVCLRCNALLVFMNVQHYT